MTLPELDDLVVGGRALALDTRGRRTGRTVRTTIGFVPDEDGGLLVSAGGPGADWALNLLADPRCRVTVGTTSRDALAMPLEGAAHERAVTALILRYGTPSEGLGGGPSFRLAFAPDPLAAPDAADA